MPEAIDIQLKKGALDLCVLALLSRGDNYAYEIASRLSDAIGMGEGTIYPLMRRMQAEGLVERREDPTDRRAKTLHQAGHGLLAGGTAHRSTQPQQASQACCTVECAARVALPGPWQGVASGVGQLPVQPARIVVLVGQG